MGYDITKISSQRNEILENNLIENPIQIPPDFENYAQEFIKKCSPFTMTSAERMYSLIKSVEYIINNKISGDFVECGVWRGGSALIMILTLQRLKINNRKIHLFDTFDGMSEPTAVDLDFNGQKAGEMLTTHEKNENDHLWAYAPLEKVQDLVYSTGYPKDKIIFYKGKVEETIPTNSFNEISILRLDTDWYESTKHELNHLYPILSRNGVLIIDDYGHWQGARKAVDEYFKEKPILLNRIDYTGRIGIKTN